MPLYRKKPVVIEARQYTGGDNVRDIVSWCGEEHPMAWYENGELRIRTLESGHGSHRAEPGDFIIRGVKGEFYPCKADIFEMTYEPVEPAAPAKKETPR